MLMSLLKGHVSPSERPSTELAAVTAERWYMAPGVRRIEIRQNGVVGTLFLPPGEHDFLLSPQNVKAAMVHVWPHGVAFHL